MSDQTPGWPDWTRPQPPYQQPAQPGSSQQPQPWGPQQPSPPSSGQPAGGSPRRQRPALIIGAAALTAALVGGTAGVGGGYVGSRLAAEPSPSAVAGSASPSESATPAGPVEDAVDVAAKVLPSAVTIQIRTTQGRGTGSGFVLDDRGRVMTNNHVVENAMSSEPIIVTFNDGSRLEADVVGRSASYDLAVLQVKGSDSAKLHPVEIGDSAGVKIGQPAIAVGSPLGLGGTVTQGIISAIDRPVVVDESSGGRDASSYINALQTDAPINPGNSGGPLVDSAGRVIGVNSAILSLGSSESGGSGNIGVGFAIPINQAAEIGDMLIKDGRATYPTIGANVRTNSDRDGVEITSITKNGPAAKAGLADGDEVTTLDGVAVQTMEELVVRIRTHRPGDVVKLGYTRDGEAREAEVTLAAKVG